MGEMHPCILFVEQGSRVLWRSAPCRRRRGGTAEQQWQLRSARQAFSV